MKFYEFIYKDWLIKQYILVNDIQNIIRLTLSKINGVILITPPLELKPFKFKPLRFINYKDVKLLSYGYNENNKYNLINLRLEYNTIYLNYDNNNACIMIIDFDKSNLDNEF